MITNANFEQLNTRDAIALNKESGAIEPDNAGNRETAHQSALRPAGHADAKPNRGRGMAWTLLGVFVLGAIVGVTLSQIRQRKSPVVMAVNGAPINQAMLFEALQSDSGDSTVDKLINDQLQLQYAKSLGLAPTDAQVDAELAPAKLDPTFDTKLLNSAQTIEDYKWRLRVRMAQAFVMGAGVTVTDADMHRYYQEQIDPSNPQALYYTPATCSISVIVTSTKDRADLASKALSVGTPFDVVAREYSQDSSAPAGGTLPTIVYGRSRMVSIPGMQDALFGLRIGQIMQPRLFAGGWWIARCISKSPHEIVPFKYVEGDCRLGAMYEKGRAVHGDKVNEDYAQYQRAANVQAFWPQYQPLAQQQQ